MTPYRNTRPRHSVIGYVGLFLILVATASPFSATAGELSLSEAAKDLGSNYDRFYAAKDFMAMAGLFAEDGILVSPSGKVVRGRKELIEYYKARFASGARQHAIRVDEVHGLADTGYSLAHFSVVVPESEGKFKEEHGTIVAIYQHDKDNWHLKLVQPSVQGNDKR